MDVLDNTVSGVATTASSRHRAIGLWAYNNKLGSVEGNRIRDLWAGAEKKWLAGQRPGRRMKW